MKPLKDISVTEGQSAEFVCELSKPNYQVTWMQANVVIEFDDNRFKQETEGTTYKLYVPKATSDMTAEYMISAGEEKSSARLTVTGTYCLIVLAVAVHVGAT